MLVITLLIAIFFVVFYIIYNNKCGCNKNLIENFNTDDKNRYITRLSNRLHRNDITRTQIDKLHNKRAQLDIEKENRKMNMNMKKTENRRERESNNIWQFLNFFNNFKKNKHEY